MATMLSQQQEEQSLNIVNNDARSVLQVLVKLSFLPAVFYVQ